MHKILKLLGSYVLMVNVAACGTTYRIPEVGPAALTAAHHRIAEAGNSKRSERASDETAAMAARVVADVLPAAVAFCRAEQPVWAPRDCDFRIEIDRPGDPQPNAFQTRDPTGRPLLIVNWALLESVDSDHELAFVMAHEAGHQIGGHLRTKERQAMAGAILGGIMAVVVAGAVGAFGGYADASTVQAVSDMTEASVQLGAYAGMSAYSQTYELEADYLSAFLSAAAGYDPAIGAAWFARMTALGYGSRDASLWTSHPSSPERLAVVAKAVEEIVAARDDGRDPRPTRALRR